MKNYYKKHRHENLNWKKVMEKETRNSPITYFPKEDGNGFYPYVVLPFERECSPQYLRAVREGFLYMLEEELERADTVILPEAKGFTFAYVFSDLGLNIAFARKRDYRLPNQIRIKQRKAYKGECNEMFIVGMNKDEKVIISDSIISSGNTMIGIIKGLEEQTNCEIVGIGAVYERGDGIKRIKEETGYEAKGLARLEIENGKPKIKKFFDEDEKLKYC
jgi:adenine/guanine phosphoribosyltransferase-like PRPP-binding protein